MTPPDRSIDDYLEEVAAQLRLSDGARRDVIDELETHLTEAADAAQERGADRAEAERQAIERFGPAGPLGRRLDRTHRSRRRLLAAVGGSLLPTFGNAIQGYVVGAAIVLAGMLALALGIGVVSRVFGVSPPSWSADRPMFSIISGIVFWFALWWAVAHLVRAAAPRAGWSPAAAWRPIGIGVALVTGFLALTARMPHSWISAAVWLLIPVVGLASAWWVAAGPGKSGWTRVVDRLLLSKLAIASLLLVIAGSVGGLVAGSFGIDLFAVLGGPSSTSQELRADPGRIGAQQREPGSVVVEPWSVSGDHPVTIFVDPVGPEVDWTRYMDLRLEAWRADGPVDTGRPLAVDPDVEAPLTSVAVDVVGDRVEMNLATERGTHAYLFYLVATETATGTRVVLGEPGFEQVTFYGSVIDWLLAG